MFVWKLAIQWKEGSETTTEFVEGLTSSSGATLWDHATCAPLLPEIPAPWLWSWLLCAPHADPASASVSFACCARSCFGSWASCRDPIGSRWCPEDYDVGPLWSHAKFLRHFNHSRLRQIPATTGDWQSPRAKADLVIFITIRRTFDQISLLGVEVTKLKLNVNIFSKSNIVKMYRSKYAVFATAVHYRFFFVSLPLFSTFHYSFSLATSWVSWLPPKGLPHFFCFFMVVWVLLVVQLSGWSSRTSISWTICSIR